MENLKEKFITWLNDILSRDDLSYRMLYFIIHELSGDENYAIELCAYSDYDPYDADWADNDMIYTSFDEDNDFGFAIDIEWQECLDMVAGFIKSYLEKGQYADDVKNCKAVLYGFTDGDVCVAYSQEEE